MLISLNYYDIVHTIYLCQQFPEVREANPLMRYLLNTDFRTAITAKMAVVMFFILVMTVYSRQHFARSFIITGAIVLIYALVAGWHLVGMDLTIWYLSLGA